MRIAMLHVDLPVESKGGVAFQVARLAETLARRGHDVVVFTLSPPTGRDPFEVRQLRRWRRLARTRLGRLFVLPVAFAARRYDGFDVVHVHGDGHLLSTSVPVVRTFYGSARDEARHATSWPRRASQAVHAAFEAVDRRRADVTVGISRSTEAVVGSLDRVIPCGVDRALFRPGSKAAKPTVLFVGTMGGRKRGDLLLRAFQRDVLPRVPDAELWVVADEEAVGRNVRHFRRLPDEELATRFREAWVFSLPSSYEGFGVPYIEAMASGTPVLATPNAGAREILGDGVGVITELEDLGVRLAELLVDPSRREALAAAGLAASEPYGWDRVADAYEEAYRAAMVVRG